MAVNIKELGINLGLSTIALTTLGACNRPTSSQPKNLPAQEISIKAVESQSVSGIISEQRKKGMQLENLNLNLPRKIDRTSLYTNWAITITNNTDRIISLDPAQIDSIARDLGYNGSVRAVISFVEQPPSPKDPQGRPVSIYFDAARSVVMATINMGDLGYYVREQEGNYDTPKKDKLASVSLQNLLIFALSVANQDTSQIKTTKTNDHVLLEAKQAALKIQDEVLDGKKGLAISVDPHYN